MRAARLRTARRQPDPGAPAQAQNSTSAPSSSSRCSSRSPPAPVPSPANSRPSRSTAGTAPAECSPAATPPPSPTARRPPDCRALSPRKARIQHRDDRRSSSFNGPRGPHPRPRCPRTGIPPASSPTRGCTTSPPCRPATDPDGNRVGNRHRRDRAPRPTRSTRASASCASETVQSSTRPSNRSSRSSWTRRARFARRCPGSSRPMPLSTSQTVTDERPSPSTAMESRKPATRGSGLGRIISDKTFVSRSQARGAFTLPARR